MVTISQEFGLPGWLCLQQSVSINSTLFKLRFRRTKFQIYFLQLLTCKISSCVTDCPPNCLKLDKTNGQTNWTEYNQLPSILGWPDGRSFINTPKGVYAFGGGGIAFLPKGKKEWTDGPTFPNSNFKFYYSCPVLISDTEILLLGIHKALTQVIRIGPILPMNVFPECFQNHWI